MRRGFAGPMQKAAEVAQAARNEKARDVRALRDYMGLVQLTGAVVLWTKAKHCHELLLLLLVFQTLCFGRQSAGFHPMPHLPPGVNKCRRQRLRFDLNSPRLCRRARVFDVNRRKVVIYDHRYALAFRVADASKNYQIDERHENGSQQKSCYRFTHATTTLSPLLRHSAQTCCFVPPLGLPSFNSMPLLVSITSRPPQRGHCNSVAGFGIARTRCLTCSAGLGALGLTMLSFGTATS